MSNFKTNEESQASNESSDQKRHDNNTIDYQEYLNLNANQSSIKNGVKKCNVSNVNHEWSSSGITRSLISEDRFHLCAESAERRDISAVDKSVLKRATQKTVPTYSSNNSTCRSQSDRYTVSKTPSICGATRKYLPRDISSSIGRRATQGDENNGNKEESESNNDDGERREKVKGKQKKSKNQNHILGLLRYQIVEALVDEECRTCHNKQKRCCCCYVCNLCCHCVCPEVCHTVFQDANNNISTCELNVLRRLGVCSNCDSPLCSAALHGFQSFTRNLDKEEILREFLHQCWEDVSYLICLSNNQDEVMKSKTRSMLGCQLPQRYVKKLMRDAVTEYIPPHRHCNGKKCHE